MIIAPWGLTIKPGATYKYEIPPFANLKISNAALGAVLEDELSRTTLTIETEDRPPADSEDEDEEELDEDSPQRTDIVLTSLTPGKIEQSIHDITFSFPALLKIKAIGKNTIHLGGNLIAEPETDESDSEDGYLDEVGIDELNSDIEIHPDAIEVDAASTDGDRFELLDGAPQAKAGQKRPREDDLDEDEDEAEAKPATLTKQQKKKLNKKLKTQNGEAIPVGAPSTDKKGTAKEKQEKGLDSSPEASKKEGKEKKEHKKEEKEKKKEEKKEKKETKEKKEKKEQTNSAPTASTSVGSPPSKKALSGGLVIEDSKVGTGRTAKAGAVCAMRYIGKLSNGTTFDSNTKGKPFTFKLGAGQVIKGWDQGIAGMQEGGERMITVPPALGYGNKKLPDIPANSTLQFEVKLLSVK